MIDHQSSSSYLQKYWRDTLRNTELDPEKAHCMLKYGKLLRECSTSVMSFNS